MIRKFMFLAALVAVASSSSPARAYLGSFGPIDGYQIPYNTVYGDVTYYNAGQWGPNAGGGPYAHVVADSGLWSLQSPVGAFFATAANRAVYTASGPPYPAAAANTAPSYMVGSHFNGHNNDGYNLAFRNETTAGTGPAIYHYNLDTYDTGGPVPSLVTSGIVTIGFYFLPNPTGPPNPAGNFDHKFTLSLRDNLGNTGLEWGYARDNTVAWRSATTDPWTYTSIIADQSNWDGIEIEVDLDNNTYGIDYYDVGTNTWSVLVPAGTLQGTALQNVTTLRWQLEDAVSGGVGGKNYFDDFSVKATVPEPSSIAMFVIGCASLLPVIRRRRKRNV